MREARSLQGGQQMDDVAVLVVSCDKFQDLWHPFFACFFKFWPDCPYPVYLGSNFLRYSDGRVRSVLIGDDIDYSANLLAMLKAIPQDWVIVWIEDRILSAKVNTGRLAKMIRSAREQGAVYLKLLSNYPLAVSATNSAEAAEIPPGSPYRISVTVALWNKAALIGLLCPGETAWDLERHGSRRSDHVDAKFLALSIAHRNNPPISDVHVIIKGRLIRDARAFLQKEGLEHDLLHRPLQTLRSYWYVKAYLLLADLHLSFKWLWQRRSTLPRQNSSRT